MPGPTRRRSMSGSRTFRCRPGARRPPGCKVALGADWIDVRHDGVLVARHTRSLHKGWQREPGAGPLPEGSSCTGRARWPVPPPWSVPGPTGVFTKGHQRFWDTARRKAGDRDGTKALTGVLLLHRTLPTEAVLAGIDAAVGGAAPSSSGPGHPSGCGGPWRKFRYTLANFVSPDMPPGQPARAGLWTNTPGVKRRSQTGHGRPGVVPRRDLGCGVPRGIPPIPGARSNRAGSSERRNA